MDIKREEGKKLILEIGANIRPQAKILFPDDKILYMDIDKMQKPDIVMDAGKMNFKEKFDVIFASHVLEHFPYWDTFRILKAWTEALVVGGELHIIVPSWEWSARQVLSEEPQKAIFAHTFASQINEWEIHRAMFTMRLIRKLMEAAGLSITVARNGPYTLIVNKEECDAEQHYVVGVKI